MGAIANRVLERAAATGAVREITASDGSREYIIPRAQRNLHITFEALAVFVAAPALSYIAYTNRKTLPAWQQGALYSIAGLSLAVDGYLLVQYMRKDT
jgi:hypothetical protein